MRFSLLSGTGCAGPGAGGRRGRVSALSQGMCGPHRRSAQSGRSGARCGRQPPNPVSRSDRALCSISPARNCQFQTGSKLGNHNEARMRSVSQLPRPTATAAQYHCHTVKCGRFVASIHIIKSMTWQLRRCFFCCDRNHGAQHGDEDVFVATCFVLAGIIEELGLRRPKTVGDDKHHRRHFSAGRTGCKNTAVVIGASGYPGFCFSAVLSAALALDRCCSRKRASDQHACCEIGARV